MAVDWTSQEFGGWRPTEDNGGGGGAEPLIVIFETEDNGNTYTSNKTFEEINAAFLDKQQIFAYYQAKDNAQKARPLNFGFVWIWNNIRTASFNCLDIFGSDGYMEYKTFELNGSNQVTVTSYSFALTPN